MQTSFNTFAGDTQKAYQQLRQEILGEKKFSLTLLNELLDLAIEMNHILDSSRRTCRPAPKAKLWRLAQVARRCRTARCRDDVRKFGIHPYDAVVGTPYNPALHERVGSTRVEGMDALRALMIAETKREGLRQPAAGVYSAPAEGRGDGVIARNHSRRGRNGPRALAVRSCTFSGNSSTPLHRCCRAFTCFSSRSRFGWRWTPISRGGEQFWIWIIIVFQPLGPWVYFFAVKLRSLPLPGLRLGSGEAWEREAVAR